MQCFTLFTFSALCWYDIQKAQILQASLEKKYLLHPLMKAVADFYNGVSGTEIKFMHLNTAIVVQIVWIAFAYEKECLANEDQAAPIVFR